MAKTRCGYDKTYAMERKFKTGKLELKKINENALLNLLFSGFQKQF